MARIGQLLGTLALLACSAAGWATADRPVATVGPTFAPAATPPGPAMPPLPRSSTEDLAGGRFLIATHQLTGPFFSQTVLLLLDHGPAGAVGLIINRPTELELAKILPFVTPLRERSDKVYSGGPVDLHAVTFLVRSESEPPNSRHVVDDVHATGSKDTLLEILKSEPASSHFHAYMGYAGWGPGQLDAEVRRGDWYVAPAQPDLIFGEATPDLWQRLIREHGGVRVRGQPPSPDYS